jgi:general secretion pathway protein H
MASQRGFTLLELMIVLLIIALLLVLLPGHIWRPQADLEVKVAARALANGLRQARSEALASNRERVFMLDVAGHTFQPGQDRPLEPLNGAIELGLDTASSELVDAARGQIRFFPNGSSTGGRIRLTMQARQTQVTVDWLTGQVAIADVGP